MADESPTRGLAAASETTKQIITLSTGVATLTMTFFEKFGPEGQPLPATLYAGWFLFALSILGGLWTLGAITGAYDALDRQEAGGPLTAAQKKACEDRAMARSIRVPAMLMGLAFVSGIVMTILSVP